LPKQYEDIANYTKLADNKAKFTTITLKLNELTAESGKLMQQKLGLQQQLAFAKKLLVEHKESETSQKVTVAALETQLTNIFLI
jgi:hypothetical protein